MKCPKYLFDITASLKQAYCKNCDGCGDNPHKSTTLPPVNIFELANGLAERERTNSEKSKFVEKVSGDAPRAMPEIKLEICPGCGERSLWYNDWAKEKECMNIKCPTRGISKF